MRFVETFLIALFFVSLLLMIVGIPGGVLFAGLSLMPLAVIYFYLGFALFNEIPVLKVFKKETYEYLTGFKIGLAVVAGFFTSILQIGVLFNLLEMQGAELMSWVGLLGCIPVFAIYYFKMKNKVMVLRLSLWIVVVLTSLF